MRLNLTKNIDLESNKILDFADELAYFEIENFLPLAKSDYFETYFKMLWSYQVIIFPHYCRERMKKITKDTHSTIAIIARHYIVMEDEPLKYT